MKNRKLIAALAVAACLGLALTACSSKDDTKGSVQAEEQSTSGTETSASESTKESTGADGTTTGESGQGESNTGESLAPSKNVAEDFAKLLKEAKSVDQLYEFMDTNMEGVKEDVADTMVLGLFDYAGDLTTLSEDKLDEYSNFTSPAITDFIYMLDLELGEPAKKDGAIAISLDDLISRAGEGEFYLTQHPDSPVYDKAYSLYYQWISDAITGVEPTAENVAYMADFSEGNDSVNGRLIEEYVQVLTANGNQVNDAVKAFYAELPQKVEGMFK